MEPFLEQVARAMLAEHGKALADVAVVLPSQRSALYLRHALAKQAASAIYSPQMYTLATFMEGLSGVRTAPGEEVLLEAYEAYRSVAGDEQRPLDDFLSWSPAMLADMSEADAHLIGLQGFYRDLRSWEDIEWTFNTTPLSEGQQRMVRYWALAGKLHAALNDRLHSQGAATAGQTARLAAMSARPFPWQRIWFCGLNAFTPAERAVIDRAHAEGLARFAWDADRYYLEDPVQEAGMHLRSAMARYSEGVVPPSNWFTEVGPRMQVLRAPNDVAQAWSAAHILKDMPAAERAHTAVVLAEPSLLPAVLEALPPDIGEVNITMGLPIASLPVGALLDAYCQALAGRRDDGAWRVEDVRALLEHPYMRRGAMASCAQQVVTTLLEDTAPYRIGQRLRALFRGLPPAIAVRLDGIFADGSEEGRKQRMDHLFALVQDSMKGDALASESIYQAALVAQRVDRLLVRYGHGADPQAWRSVMDRLLRAGRIGYFGEPLAGLQIMGLLEARALDHRHVVMLGAVEGQLPSSTADRTFIPFELRRAHGLPLRDSTDAVQAYNFLRSVQRASTVRLVYPDDGNSSPPSRFIDQLAHERFEDGGMEYVDIRVAVPLRREATIEVARTDEADRAIRARLENGLSPTMLRTWLRCPLDFWFRYVAGLVEPEDPGARIPANILGEALHGVLEDLYRPWLGAELEADRVRSALAGLPRALTDKLLAQLPKERLEHGQPLLQHTMATRAAVAHVAAQADLVAQGQRIIPLAIEHAVRLPLAGARERFGCAVQIKGRMDRVEERDGLIHLLDLKTGRVDEAHLRIDAIEPGAFGGKRGSAAQLLLYAWLWMNEHPGTHALRAGLLPLQRASASEGLFVRVAGSSTLDRTWLSAMDDVLTGVVQDMLRPGVPFMHDPESTYCTFCLAQEG